MNNAIDREADRLEALLLGFDRSLYSTQDAWIPVHSFSNLEPQHKDLAACAVTNCPRETADLISGEANYFLDYEPPKNYAELSIRQEQYERLTRRVFAILRAMNDGDE